MQTTKAIEMGAPIRVLGGIATLIGLVFSTFILLIALPHSPYGCGLYEIFFSSYACTNMRPLILMAVGLVLLGVACLVCIVLSKKAKAVVASSAAGWLYAIAMGLLLFHGIAG
jgi:hypothetical protein